MSTPPTSATGPAGSDGKIRCDACPVMCYIKPGAVGACDRYANHDGQIVPPPSLSPPRSTVSTWSRS
jgi:hypothetical protein